MLQKILRIITKILLGIFIFYLITGFILVPLALTWAIPNLGTKYLKTPVKLRSAGFNPFLLQLTMDDLEVLDDQNHLMLGFDKLFVDVSFLDLFKKKYHVESLQLDGLKINVELLSGNQINLLRLVPPGIIPSEGKQPVPGRPLPTVIIDSIVLHQGQVRFTDKTIKPVFTTTVSPIELHVTHVSTDPDAAAKVKFHSNLDAKGRVSMEAVVKPLALPLEMESTFSLNSYALMILTPYIGKYTGHALRSGQMDLTMNYRISGNQLTASHKFLIQQFEFGNSVESPDALHLPFGLAIALLEDPQGKINIALPVSGDLKDPKFDYSHLIVQVVRNFFLNLVTKPFSFLASTLGSSVQGTDELGYVRFLPGRTVLSASQKEKLMTLIKGLKEHPKLLLEIEPGFDPQTDWKTIQADTFFKDYEKLIKGSSGPEGKVYQLLYQRRFGIRALWALAKKYKKGIGEYDDAELDREIKRQLIESAPPDPEALGVLALSRAKSVQDFLVLNGFDPQHLSVGHPKPTQASLGYVPLEFTLTVFGKK